MNTGFLGPAVATVLTACGIETLLVIVPYYSSPPSSVATVLTACGIETLKIKILSYYSALKLQQYLPLAVLKPTVCILLQKLL